MFEPQREKLACAAVSSDHRKFSRSSGCAFRLPREPLNRPGAPRAGFARPGLAISPQATFGLGKRGILSAYAKSDVSVTVLTLALTYRQDSTVW